jgi:catechol 2,3-dioxygenase-like lactoylglutathione lyase family enzyme
MLTQLTHVNLWVHDQNEALAFYTEKLGMELRDDVTLAEMGNFRWLTVGPPNQPDIAVVLMSVPGPPVFDADTAAKLNELVAKGAAGGLFFSTDDCESTYEDLKGRGVEFSQEPTQQPYGLDAAFRDPSGNQIRMVQMQAPASGRHPGRGPAGTPRPGGGTRPVPSSSVPTIECGASGTCGSPTRFARRQSGLAGKPVATLTPRVRDPRRRGLEHPRGSP